MPPIYRAKFEKSSADLSQCPAASIPEFVFIGRSNVGKSSLINMLCNIKGLAKTSGTPGKTQLINHFLIDESWYLVDLPGYGYARTSKVNRAGFKKMIYDYLEKRENLINVFVLVDCRHDPQKIDIEFMEWLATKNIPFSIIFTKLDKLTSTKLNKSLMKYSRVLLEKWETLPPIFRSSAESKTGKEEITHYIQQLTGDLEDEVKERFYNK